MTDNKTITVDSEVLEVLKELVRLHRDWDKGTAYVTVKFMHENDAVIKRAMEIISNTSITE